jgi:acetyltransferase
MKNGRECSIRPIRPDDAALFQEFVRGLSPRSRYSRFFASLNELPQRTLARYTQLDYGRELTLVAATAGNGRPRLLGEANYSVLPDGATCEFAVVVADDLSGCGLGSRLMRSLMAAARAQGLAVIRGEVLARNEPMLALMEALDFTVNLTDDEDVVAVWRRID